MKNFPHKSPKLSSSYTTTPLNLINRDRPVSSLVSPMIIRRMLQTLKTWESYTQVSLMKRISRVLSFTSLSYSEGSMYVNNDPTS